ncbi:AI-2E family transporter [Arsenicicoccus piscis]|nr:AI-2E family transporter [Arsenicicoccus piscis]
MASSSRPDNLPDGRRRLRERDATAVMPEHLPYPLVLVGAWSWRIIGGVVAAALLVVALRTLSQVVVPLAVALLLTVLLQPGVRWLVRRTPLKLGVAALIGVLGMIVVVVGLFGFAGSQLASGATGMRDSAMQGVQKVQDWLATNPFGLTSSQLQGYLDQAMSSLRTNSSSITSGAMQVGTTTGHFLVGMIIALIATYFFLAQGGPITRYFVRWLPRPAQAPTFEALRRGWISLGAYARTQVLVAGVDAIGIALGALILGLPFVVPLFVLVFLSSFIPILGAIVSGAVAVLIALVVKGPIMALVMLGIVLLVQQLESHVLQPFLMGKAVSLHPLAVIIAVAVGSFLLGIVGALFAVPVLAVANTVIRYLVSDDPFPALGETWDQENARDRAVAAEDATDEDQPRVGDRQDEQPDDEERLSAR